MSESHSLRSLARLVGEMREAQRRHFRTRSQGDLDASKALERRVDQAVREVLEQPSLFDRESQP